MVYNIHSRAKCVCVFLFLLKIQLVAMFQVCSQETMVVLLNGPRVAPESHTPCGHTLSPLAPMLQPRVSAIIMNSPAIIPCSECVQNLCVVITHPSYWLFSCLSTCNVHYNRIFFHFRLFSYLSYMIVICWHMTCQKTVCLYRIVLCYSLNTLMTFIN